MNTEKLKHLPDFINTKLGSGAKILRSHEVNGHGKAMKLEQDKLRGKR